MRKEYARVQKWIALSGYCGRKNAEKYIDKGKVFVNGYKVNLGDHCYSNDKITVNGETISVPDSSNFTYLIINKPQGVITSKHDNQGRKKVVDLINKKDYKENLFPVGRLDMNTTGLLIITNDGPFAQSFLHPSYGTKKTYSVTLDSFLSKKDKIEIEKGLRLEDVKLSPCKVSNMKGRTYKVVLQEGKNRQIRRMFYAKGYKVVRLERTHVGNLSLKKLNLNKGEYMRVSKSFLEETIKGKGN